MTKVPGNACIYPLRSRGTEDLKRHIIKTLYEECGENQTPSESPLLQH
jgi:hypothetical protein